MTSYRSLVYIFFACFFFMPGCTRATVPDARGAEEQEVPAIKMKCGTCHLSHDMAAMTPGLKKPVSELCFGCHKDRKPPGEHVVDVVPSMRVNDLPLTNGKMTCITCHDPHKNPYGKLLRVSPQELCRRCHLK